MIEIIKKEDCCGCSACANVCPKNCITMQADDEGFRYPIIDGASCLNCNLCEKVCPIINFKGRTENKKQKAYVAQHKNTNICKESTAGGVFTAIAEYVLRQSGVVFGVEMSDTHKVHHVKATTIEELQKFRNSKYVQSDVEMTYREVKELLDNQMLVCYSGTPCQIEGLRSYLRKNYTNLILVDVVCRAVPSPGVWEQYVQYVTEQYGPIDSIRFRDKTLGYQYSTMAIKTENNGVLRGGIENQDWLRMFFSGMIIRPSCSHCKFRSQYRNSDFTIWDCFNIHSIDSDFKEDFGTTRVLTHSEKACKIVECIQQDLFVRELSVANAVNGVKEMSGSPVMHKKRDEFYSDLNKYGIDYVLRKYFPITLKIRIKVLARKILNLFGLDKVVKHVLKKG